MRRYIKNHLKGIIKSLFDANRLLKKLAIEGSDAKIAVLLQDMQAVAIEAGETIEQHQGESTETVHLLEELCELIWEISQLPVNGKSSLCNNVQGKLELIREQVEAFPERLEVVFLPYKASMWDSLESVWKAADADPDRDAYVIPIPYYDKKQDGSFGNLHYEGDQYPEYVPITDYHNYNFEERHPDEIYIHNPYDDCNYVTSVHPFFYSANLKKYTEQLVYIPYFVLGEINPENQQAVERMKHYCMLPAVLNADRVIVQSENMRQIYVNVLKEWLGKEQAEMLDVEHKIQGLGSPKIDKIRAATREEQHIPEEWLKIIKRPDGQNKKILLYNTTLNALLKNEEKMIVKIKDVLRIMKGKQDEVALLWRPHPLIKATIASMRPELSEEYEKIVQEYCAEGWGIYDASSDLERALVISDAYYGDGGSLPQLYKQTGKPLMMQNAEIIKG